MSIRYQTNCSNIDWEQIPKLLEEGGMSYSEPMIHRKTFEASFSVIFLFDSDSLIGFGRMLSDGYRQSALYDIVVDKHYQGKGLGREITTRLMQTVPDSNFMLYASPGKEKFYQNLGFRKMKTGMILFSNSERMNDENFVEI